MRRHIGSVPASLATTSAAGPAFAQVQTTYLSCDIEASGRSSYTQTSIFRLVHVDANVPEWRERLRGFGRWGDNLCSSNDGHTRAIRAIDPARLNQTTMGTRSDSQLFTTIDRTDGTATWRYEPPLAAQEAK
jgi:hypothetical protein